MFSKIRYNSVAKCFISAWVFQFSAETFCNLRYLDILELVCSPCSSAIRLNWLTLAVNLSTDSLNLRSNLRIAFWPSDERLASEAKSNSGPTSCHPWERQVARHHRDAVKDPSIWPGASIGPLITYVANTYSNTVMGQVNAKHLMSSLRILPERLTHFSGWRKCILFLQLYVLQLVLIILKIASWACWCLIERVLSTLMLYASCLTTSSIRVKLIRSRKE